MREIPETPNIPPTGGVFERGSEKDNWLNKIVKILRENYRENAEASNQNSYAPPANVVSKEADYTCTDTDGMVYMNATGGARAITLPDATENTGRAFGGKKIDASGNAVTLTPINSQTIDGAVNLALAAQYDYAWVRSDGANWMREG